GEGRRGRAEADRPEREVDAVGVFRAARVGLEAVELTQRRQVFARQQTEQVLDGVEDRRRVWLDGDAVPGAQVAEVERREDRDDRGRRRLVAADLDAVDVGADVVGVVD